MRTTSGVAVSSEDDRRPVMAISYPSEEWIQEYQDRLNDSEEYSETGDGWGVGFNGDFVFHLVADDRLPEDRYFFVGLEDGQCTDAYEIEDPDEVDAGFVYRGDYSDWVRLNEGEVGAIDGMMSGVFELDGDMQKVMQYSDASTVQVETASEIDTEYEY
jgi:putative sterol carrier protein